MRGPRSRTFDIAHVTSGFLWEDGDDDDDEL